MPIDFAHFAEVEMHTGRILEAVLVMHTHKPAFHLVIDFGEQIGIKKSSAQLTALYTADDLVGKTIVAVTNFPPKQIGKFMSEVLVLGLHRDEQSVCLLVPDGDIKVGTRVC